MASKKICLDCLYFNSDNHKRLLEMPKGDLINRDALKEEVVKLCERINANNGITVPTLAFTRIIDNAPTVELTELCKGCQYLKDCETCDKNERPPCVME